MRQVFSLLALLVLVNAYGQRQNFWVLNRTSNLYVPTDSNARVFISAVINGGDYLDNVSRIAIDTLVIRLKRHGLWDKHLAIYPFIGTTASSQKWNLKDPRDADDAFRLTFYGNPVHNAAGIHFDGFSQYIDTHFIPSQVLSNQISASFSFYSIDSLQYSFGYDIGIQSSISSWALSLQYNTSHSPHVEISGYADPDMALSNTRAYYLVYSKTNGSLFDYNINLWRNDQEATTSYNNMNHPINSFPNFNVYIGANNGFGTPSLYSSRGTAFVTLGVGNIEYSAAIDNYNDIISFLASLNRN